MYIPSTFIHIMFMYMYMYDMNQFEINHSFIHLKNYDAKPYIIMKNM